MVGQEMKALYKNCSAEEAPCPDNIDIAPSPAQYLVPMTNAIASSGTMCTNSVHTTMPCRTIFLYSFRVAFTAPFHHCKSSACFGSERLFLCFNRCIKSHVIKINSDDRIRCRRNGKRRFFIDRKS